MSWSTLTVARLYKYVPESTQPRHTGAPDTNTAPADAPAGAAQAVAGPATPVVPQIVSASYRTDIPCFHAVWFAARLKAGFCQVQNPYGGGSRRVGLDPVSAPAFVF